MSIIVYYVEPHDIFTPLSAYYNDDEMWKAMKDMAEMRRSGMRHVSISAELAGMVGKPGVDAVTNGVTPDGHVYEWSKAGRAGKMKRSEMIASNPNKATIS